MENCRFRCVHLGGGGTAEHENHDLAGLHGECICGTIYVVHNCSQAQRDREQVIRRKRNHKAAGRRGPCGGASWSAEAAAIGFQVHCGLWRQPLSDCRAFLRRCVALASHLRFEQAGGGAGSESHPDWPTVYDPVHHRPRRV